MKIIPINDNQIRVETDKGTFDIYSLVGGGLEIHITGGFTKQQEGSTMKVGIGARVVVIEQE